MTNKVFIDRLVILSRMSPNEANDLLSALLSEIENRLADEDSITIPDFGTFEVKKKLERVVVHPLTKQKMLVPPKMTVNFKSSPSLKSKVKLIK